MTPIRAAFICSKACDIIAEDAFSVATQHFIGLFDIKWGTLIRPRSRYVTWYVGEMPTSSGENSQLVWTECLESSRCMREGLIGKQIESCTLGVLQAGSEEHLKHPYRWLRFACCKACDSVGEDEFALLVSIPSSCFPKSTNSHFLFWTLQEDHTPHKVT